MARLSYVELPVGATSESKAFYTGVFGWTFADYGPEYAATTSGDVDVGLDASADAVRTLLPVIEVDDIEATLLRVEAAGGVVTVPVFAFPGGRRFHFRDPHGNELAAMVPDAAS